MRKSLVVLAGVALASAAWSSAVLAQRPLRGTVTDAETGAPIVSARITVKGGSAGTYTNADGKFSFTVPSGAITLDVRRIGYAPKTVPVGADDNDIKITLKSDVLQLGQEVITGQATTISRRNLNNDVAVVSG